MEKMMSRGDDNKFLNPNFRTCVLKVNIHCEGCLKKIKKLLKKIDGVYDSSIDADQGKVTVVGFVDSATLIEKLEKGGKHAEEWPTKAANKKNITNQLQNFQLDPAKVEQLMRQQRNGNSVNLSNFAAGAGGVGEGKGKGKGKGKGGKAGQQDKPPPPLKPKKKEQGKGLKEMLSNLKDLKFPFKKDKKSAKFQVSSEDEYSEDDLSDDSDSYDDEYMDDHQKMKGKNAAVMAKDKSGQNGGGGKAKKGGGALAQVINKAKNATNKGANNNKGANGHQNQANGGKKGNGGKNDGMIGGGHKPNMMGQGYNAMNFSQMGNMQPNFPQMGQFPAVQGLPSGYYGGMPGMAPHEMNPYQQQQYMHALMQQRRMMMMNGQGGAPAPAAFPQMSYGYGYSQPAAYAPNAHGSFGMFSDEDPHGCSVM